MATLYTVNRTSVSPYAATVASSGKAAIASSPLFRDYLYLPESDARFLRIILKSPENKNGYGIRDIAIKPLDWAASENDFFMAVAKDAPRGSYPRPFLSEQSYWTVVGVDRDSAEALINEEGMIEVGRGHSRSSRSLHRRQTHHVERCEDLGSVESGSAAAAAGDLEHQGSRSHHQRFCGRRSRFIRAVCAVPHHQHIRSERSE